MSADVYWGMYVCMFESFPHLLGYLHVLYSCMDECQRTRAAGGAGVEHGKHRVLIRSTNHTFEQIHSTNVQPIADRVAQHLEIISKNLRFSARRTKILMRLIMCYLVLMVNPMDRILVR